MKNKLLYTAIVSIFSLLFISCKDDISVAESRKISELEPQAQVAVNCYKYIKNNDYSKFIDTLHPKIIENSGGEKKLHEMFTSWKKPMEDITFKVDIDRTKAASKDRKNRYYVVFRKYKNGETENYGLNTVHLVETSTGWKVIDI